MPIRSNKWDIVSLFEHFAGVQTVGKEGYVNGVLEVHANCPWCPTSKDSLVLRRETGQFSHAIRSYGCGRVGDGLDFLQEYVGMTYQEAVEEMDVQDVQFNDQKPAERHVNSSDVAPPKQWIESATVLLTIAEAYLWSGKRDAVEALHYLYKRGFTDATIKKARLGYVPLQENGKWLENTFEQWGLDPAKHPGKTAVRIPDGILMPYFVGGQVWKLEMKRPGAIKMPEGQILGSVDCLYGVDSVQYGEIAMMTESVFDALSVQQEAGDLVNVVAVGGTPKCKALKWIGELKYASFVLQSFDEDKAGDIAANTWYDILYAQKDSKVETDSLCLDGWPEIERWSTMICKDANDLLQLQLAGKAEGLTVREWVELGVDLARHDMALAMPTLAGDTLENFDPAEHAL